MYKNKSKIYSSHFSLFLARDSIHAERAICYRNSGRLSVRTPVCHTGGSVTQFSSYSSPITSFRGISFIQKF